MIFPIMLFDDSIEYSKLVQHNVYDMLSPEFVANRVIKYINLNYPNESSITIQLLFSHKWHGVQDGITIMDDISCLLLKHKDVVAIEWHFTPPLIPLHNINWLVGTTTYASKYIIHVHEKDIAHLMSKAIKCLTVYIPYIIPEIIINIDDTPDIDIIVKLLEYLSTTNIQLISENLSDNTLEYYKQQIMLYTIL